MYDLEGLATFAAVMESRSLTLSARRLGVAKSTLSRRIAHLEAELGQPLLRRQANRLLPTEAGVLFFEHAREMLRLAEQSRLALDDLRAEVHGELVIKVHPVLARGWMAQQAEYFLERHPRARVELRLLQTPPSAPDLHAVHLWVGDIGDCGLRQETLGWLRRGIYAHPDYLLRRGTPHHPRDLEHHAWLDLLGDAERGLVLSHPDESDHPLTPVGSRLRVDQPVLHADAIVRGQGIGLIPHWMAQRRQRHHPDTLVQCLVGWETPPLPITLLYAYGHQPRKVGALLEQLRHNAPAAWRDRRPEKAESAFCS